MKENKLDLLKAKELVKKAKLDKQTALNDDQEEDAKKELKNAYEVLARQEKYLAETEKLIKVGTEKVYDEMMNAPIDSTATEDEINKEKKEAIKEAAQAEKEIISAVKKMDDVKTDAEEKNVKE